MTVPNCLLLGAPKCGTSSIFDWLNLHPDVCGSQPKETFYLMDEENPLQNKISCWGTDGDSGFDSFYCGDSASGKRIVLEGTVHNLYQSLALSFCENQSEAPICIAFIRRPLDRIYSSFRYTANNLGRMKAGFTFEQYVSAHMVGDFETISQHVLDEGSKYVLRRDFEYSMYSKYLDRWSSIVGPDKLKIYLFEDLKEDPASLMNRICKDLEIAPEFYTGFSFVGSNKTYSVRSPRTQRLARRLGSIIPETKVKIAMKKFYERVQYLNKSSSSERDQIPSELYARVVDYFQDELIALKCNYGVNLSLGGKSCDAV